ncbi:hypothetical protein GCM10007108_03070 [Thermogymnomonas acidicola]|uniref:NurA domain-containing protein n=1 Tax=Thermogymnomonas acidicola TaxID=399579 RepID=A0AA37BQL8_9ARCH|nr:DNA double-strand break repair nuclease NurA [Thermogymnomonas acidicola]GGM68345.1 hypothetical protein GCM10007108_03070 [Thermogymnomonas acidicola]
MQDGIREAIEYLGKVYRAREPGRLQVKGNSSSYEISPRNIMPIEGEWSGLIGVVDGGNQGIVEGPGCTVQFNRVYGGIWDSRSASFVEEYTEEFVSVTTVGSGEVKTALMPLSGAHALPREEDLVFRAGDPSLLGPSGRMDMSLLSSVARRFSERSMASFISSRLSDGSVLLLDGTLQSTFTNESAYLSNLVSRCRSRGVFLSALAKTSNMVTDTGVPLYHAVSTAERQSLVRPPWFMPLADIYFKDHKVRMHAVRMHPMGRIFRFEMNLEQALELEREKRTGEVMSALLSTSLDPVSPGYPYCLVHADTMARVTGDEASMLRALAVSSAFDAGLGDMLQDIVESVDYHDVLNTFVGGGDSGL